MSDVVKQTKERECNNKIIIDITAENFALIEMNDKLFITEDTKAEVIDKLVMDNNSLKKCDQR